MRSIRAGLVTAALRWLQLPRALRLLAPVVIMLALWYLSSQPPSPGAQSLLRELLSNGAHIVAYFGLAGAWLLAVLPQGGAQLVAVTRRVTGTVLGLSVAYGIVDEVHQSFVPGRAPSIWDVASDASGSTMAVFFVLWAFSGERHFARRMAWCLLLGIACVAGGTLLDG